MQHEPTSAPGRGIARTLAALACVLVLAALTVAAPPAAAPAKHPNVVLIVVDDLGWAGVGYHAAAMPTPNVDRLAKQGTQLDRFYAYPVCSPTRAALLTGRMPRRFGILNPLNGREPGLPAPQPTLASAFQAAGYATALVGKWHLGAATSPRQQGYEHFYGLLGSGVDYFTHAARNGQPDWQRDGTQVQETGYSTDLLADDAVRRIASRDATKPLFLQVNFNAPHDPLSAPDELVKKHADKGAKLGLYAAVVEAMDRGIGRILDAIDAAKLADDTIVVFLSDNGASGAEGGSNAPLRAGKGTVYEGGIRTPAIVRWRGTVAAGGVLAQPFAVQDLFPTLAEAAAVPLPDGAKLDGTSQWGALRRGARTERPPFAVASFDTAVFDGDWKLIAFQDGTRALYDLKQDPGERTDRSSTDAAVADRLAAVAATLTKDLPPIEAKRQGPGSGQRPGGGGSRGGPPARRGP